MTYDARRSPMHFLLRESVLRYSGKIPLVFFICYFIVISEHIHQLAAEQGGLAPILVLHGERLNKKNLGLFLLAGEGPMHIIRKKKYFSQFFRFLSHEVIRIRIQIR